MALVKILSNVCASACAYSAGDVVELSDADARTLCLMGKAEPAKAKPKKAKQKDKPKG